MPLVGITGNLINAYFVCRRKLWLFAHEVSPRKDNQLLEIGRIIAEESYRREIKEIAFGSVKIDLIRKRDGEFFVSEVKKSSRFLKPAEMQLAFYLKELKKRGILAKGELLIPKEKKRFEVELSDEIEKELESAIADIKRIILLDKPPEVIKNKFCNKCSYFEFCFS